MKLHEIPKPQFLQTIQDKIDIVKDKIGDIKDNIGEGVTTVIDFDLDRQEKSTNLVLNASSVVVHGACAAFGPLAAPVAAGAGLVKFVIAGILKITNHTLKAGNAKEFFWSAIKNLIGGALAVISPLVPVAGVGNALLAVNALTALKDAGDVVKGMRE